MVSLIVSVVFLPFFLWSWIRHHHDEDASISVAIIGWLVLVAAAGGIIFWVVS